MIDVLSAGPLATVQDLGRQGYERYGVPVSGAMDRFALQAANLLVGNAAGAAAIETALGELQIKIWQEALTAAAGCGYRLLVNGVEQPTWTAVRVGRGDQIQLVPEGFGWGCLAFSGGLQVPLVLESRATYLRGRFGGWLGRSLQPGDQLALNPGEIDPALQTGAFLRAERRLQYSSAPTVRVIPGPHLDRFAPEALAFLTNGAYQVRSDSDRMGYRLQGLELPLLNGADILSEGMPMGAIQVPASGQPLVMLTERPATGGYARIGTVISADIPLLVQSPPGLGQVRFETCSLSAAQESYRRQVKDLQQGIELLPGAAMAAGMGALE